MHKERNVADHLPEAERLWMLRQMRRAWKNPDPDEAEQDLRGTGPRIGHLTRGGAEPTPATPPAGG